MPIPASANPLRKFELIVSLEILLHIADNSPSLPSNDTAYFSWFSSVTHVELFDLLTKSS